MAYDCFFQDISNSVLTGQFDRLSAKCDVALPVYVDGRVIVDQTRAAIQAGLEIYRAILRRDGVTRAETRIVAQSLSRGRHSTFWVETTYLDSGNQKVGGATIRYFCRRGACGLVVQMVEYLETSWATRVQDFESFLAA